MNNMQRILLVVIIGIVLLGAGVYLYSNSSQNKTEQTGEFSKSLQNYPEAKTSEIVELKDGDSYNLTASIVKKCQSSFYI